jgi:putative tryptophan/tyrosine transport system substrate-binding protein
MHRRRNLIAWATLGLGAVLAPAWPQPRWAGTTRRIGVLSAMADPEPNTPGPQRSFPMALRRLGWAEGENLVIERLFADFRTERLRGLAEALLRNGPDLMITVGASATLAAARATRTVPVLFVQVPFPVEQGLIESFARPGRNLSGLSFQNGREVFLKQLEYLREVAPASRRVASLFEGAVAETLAGGHSDVVAMLNAAAKGLGFEVRLLDTRSIEDVDAALAEAAGWRAQALLAGGTFAYAQRAHVADFALRHFWPSASADIELVDAGVLLAYGPSPAEGPRLLADLAAMADRVLRGANPADLPVEQPSRYDLAINLKTARALGLAIPQAVRLRADLVIE